MKCLQVSVEVSPPLEVAVSAPSPVMIGITREDAVPAFSGAYEVTPGDEAQTIPCAGLRMTSNITINPVPSNYGLIQWDGSTITVS